MSPRGHYPHQRRNPSDRFDEKIAKGDGCWMWTGLTNERGYGRFFVSRADGTVLAHRFSYARAIGPISEGMLICHHCDTPGCVRPEHLFAGTQLDNLRDMSSKGRHHRWNAKLTHCKRGHPLSGENLRMSVDGKRICRTCSRERQRKHPDTTKCRKAA